MIKKKIITTLVVSIATVGLASCFGGGESSGEGQTDANLYHLTLSANNDGVNKADLKATYGYGEPSPVIVEGIRDIDEIEELKRAGATDADIEKAGKRQADGSYYFFAADPIYLEAPTVTGYKLDGFYDKATGKLEDKACVYGPSDNRQRSRWNMNDKDTELEARYSEVRYNITFDNMEDDETNPNISKTNYQFLRDGENCVLLDATTTNKLKTFVCWEYQDTLSNLPIAPWIELEGGKLPTNYEEETMRIHAKFSYTQLSVEFNFEKYIDPETSENLEWEDAIESMYICSNLAKVDGVDVVPGEETAVTKTSVIKVDGVNGWINIFFTLKPEYKIYSFKLNGVKNDRINASYMNPPYVSLLKEDLTEDSTITFVLSAKNPE